MSVLILADAADALFTSTYHIPLLEDRESRLQEAPESRAWGIKEQNKLYSS